MEVKFFVRKGAKSNTFKGKYENGMLLVKTGANGPVKAGYNPMVCGAACKRLGLDPLKVMASRGPAEALLAPGENEGAVFVEIVEIAEQTRAEGVAEICKNIAASYGEAVASAWAEYRSSDRADAAEDVFAADILRQAGY